MKIVYPVHSLKFCEMFEAEQTWVEVRVHLSQTKTVLLEKSSPQLVRHEEARSVRLRLHVANVSRLPGVNVVIGHDDARRLLPLANRPRMPAAPVGGRCDAVFLQPVGRLSVEVSSPVDVLLVERSSRLGAPRRGPAARHGRGMLRSQAGGRVE